MKSFSDLEITALSSWLEEREDFVFLETSRVTSEESRSLLFLEPLRWLVCNDPSEALDFLGETGELQKQGFFLAGWIGYEFGYLVEPSLNALASGIQGPYAVMGVFSEPVIFDHNDNVSTALRQLVAETVHGPGRTHAVNGLRTSISQDEYVRALDRIKQYIVAGDTYQVNYTLKLQFALGGSPASFYCSLRRNQPVAYGGWIRQGGRDIMSFSPELFFRANRDRITVKPMKGTMSRGVNLADDKRKQELLCTDVKNCSENVMIVDLLRNDLGHLLHDAGGGAVKPRSLFDVEVYDSLLQMTSTIDGIPAEAAMPCLPDLLKALFPCGSVTGAPKIRTMKIIRELEKEPRGVYCGAVGFCNSDEAVFNVPIRTVVLERGKGEMGVGSGIVFDSDPESEWAECLLKGNFLISPRPDFQLIETLLWQPGSGYWLLDEHKNRLADSARYFFFSFEIDGMLDLLEGTARDFASAMRVRLLLYRDGSMELSSSLLDTPPDRDPFAPLVQDPLPVVVFSALPTDPADVYLYHKTTRRDLYTNERRKALDQGYHEVLFVNTQNEVTEGSVTNVFIAGHGRLLTPPLTSGLLDGTFRRFLVSRGRVEERVLSREDVLGAEAVYIGNSVRGLVQVAVRGS